MSAVHAINNQLTLEQLKTALNEAKRNEALAREVRIQIEGAILSHPDVVLKEEGTVSVDGLSISTGYTRTWDQAKLSELIQKIHPNFWPFKTEFKEVRALSKQIEQTTPDLWNELSHALTLKPKKPTVTIKE